MEQKKSIGHKILYFPLTKILIGVIAISLVLTAAQLLLDKTFGVIQANEDWKYLIKSIIGAGIVLLAYKYLYQYYEKREVTELSSRNLSKNIGFGILLGFGIMSLTIFFIYITGGYKITSTNSISNIISPIAMGISSGVIEEILLRGIFFRIIEEKLGSYIAILISGLLFGFMHISNPNSSTFAALAISIEAGVLLAAAYMLTRNLWFPIAIHFMWNFTQSAIYGANVSGTSTTKTLVNAKFSGSDLITGGNFGPEASIQAMLIGLTTAIIILYYCHKKQLIIAPFWRKNNIDFWDRLF